MAGIEEEYRIWASDKESVLRVLSVELREASDTDLTLLIKGRKVQILIPSTYHNLGLPTLNDDNCSEVFLLLHHGKISGKMKESMLALSERLEQISIQPKALHRVLDLLLATLQKLEVQGGSKDSNSQHVEHEDIRDREISDEEESDDQSDYSDSKCRKLEEGCLGDDDGDVEAYCHGIAMDEAGTVCPSEYEIRERLSFQDLVEDARRQCEAVQVQKSRDLKNPLMWFCVGTKPSLLTVQLQFDLVGMVDERIAAGLGLTLDEPVSLNLEFSKNMWTETTLRSIKMLKYERIYATQFSRISEARIAEPDDIDRFLEASDGAGHRSYGLDVLLPELTSRFFAVLNRQGSESSGDYVHMEGLHENVNNKNPFIGLALAICHQLRLLPGRCLICWKKLSCSVTRMRTCDEDLCLYRFEELGLGVSVLDEVKSSPELVEVELSLAHTALESARDVFEPFPAFLLQDKEIRGRSGWFSNDTVRESASKLTNLTQKMWDDLEDMDESEPLKSNKNSELLREILASIPPIDKIQKCADERSLKKVLTRSWYCYLYDGYKRAPHGGPVVAQVSPEMAEANPSPRPMHRSQLGGSQAEMVEVWRKVAKMAYDVMRFILMTNRLSLYRLRSEEEVLQPKTTPKNLHGVGVGFHPMMKSKMKLNMEPKDLHAENSVTMYQFAVLHDSPEREARFIRRREEANGSFFAYHGSSAENWYSILRNGLRSMSDTAFMSTGAAHGEGIYLATNLSTSIGYARNGLSREQSVLKDGFRCVAICEVVNGSARSNTGVPSSSRQFEGKILVIPRENERDVAIRYFLVFKPRSMRSFASFEIDGCMLSGSQVDLLLHYQQLLRSYVETCSLQQEARMWARRGILRAIAAKSQGIDINAPPPSPFPSKNSFDLIQRRSAEKFDAAATTMMRTKRPKTSTAPNSSTSAPRAVMQEYKNLLSAIAMSPPIECLIHRDDPAPMLSGTTVSIPDESNLCLWRISLNPYLFKESKNLYNDFKELKKLRNSVEDITVELEVKFHPTFPFDPPFVRVLSPRFKTYSGHVTIGGSICMELLTASGWSPACNFESLLVQVVMAFLEGEGRLDMKVRQEYQESEAREAFLRAARSHGWNTS
ncbi:uncharacterized protein [Physcomitrium patens]|uniref:UBC core domain-containing protein n=1 Tax=Physcomitrium patens TaxID=3218 RepID=A9T974_PHYPA|nr:uncharacterized protein LOC112273383 [Physcomitrium patens]XP_024357854.1 uncharacterized protein LOC112273383 [Physcomitrium patens]XP_024357855.1 uncharacterized protein LOC112273383 [Physcomitrium patens]PNR32735.1 hypothetical protein PHYPA_024677 [Physcomitrium patens]|eukprot:XP_024357853.1 uncharacterized protein LOC112273383 [Physcomitrella patens]